MISHVGRGRFGRVATTGGDGHRRVESDSTPQSNPSCSLSIFNRPMQCRRDRCRSLESPGESSRLSLQTHESSNSNTASHVPEFGVATGESSSSEVGPCAVGLRNSAGIEACSDQLRLQDERTRRWIGLQSRRPGSDTPSGRHALYPPMYSYHRDYISQRRLSRKGKCVPPKMQGRKFSRSIVMVDALDEKVPRGKCHTTLQQNGFIVRFVEFWTHWNEEEVRDVIEAAFEGVVDTTAQHLRFDFLQSCEGNLVLPTVLSGHVWLGDKLQRLAGQGSLYIRPTYEALVARDDHEAESCCFGLRGDDGRVTCCADDHDSDFASAESRNHADDQYTSEVQILLDMLPGRDPDKIAGLLRASEGNLIEAVDTLLCEEEGTLSCEEDESPPSPSLSLEQPCSSSVSLSTDPDASLLRGANQIIDFTKSRDIVVSRENIMERWIQLLQKRSKSTNEGSQGRV